MFENEVELDNQQPSPRGKVQRLERKLVAPSGAKWGEPSYESRGLRYSLVSCESMSGV